MKVLLVHNYYREPGGEDAVFQSEGRLLAERGHQVVTFTESNRATREIGAAGTAMRAVWSRDTHRSVAALLGRERPDVAHFHNTFPLISPSAYYACRDRGVPVVQTLHNYRLICPTATLFRRGRVCEDCVGRAVAWPGVVHGCYRGSRAQTLAVAGMLAAHRLAGTWSDAVTVYVALSEHARGRLIAGGLPAERIVVKPNFVDPDPGVSPGPRDFALFVGRLVTEKGVLTMLRAWRELADIPLRVVGDGPLMVVTKAAVRDGPLPEVQVLGWRPREEVLAMMAQARLLVFPSEWYEGFPVTVAEAFASGVPVVASRLGSMAEIVRDGETGSLFETGDAHDLALKVRHLWSSSAEQDRMSRTARSDFETHYNADRNYDHLMQIYQRARAPRQP